MGTLTKDNPYSRFDWDEFIRDLSRIDDKSIRLKYYKATAELNKKSIPDFVNIFKKKSFNYSAKERQLYYDQEKISDSIKLMFENLPCSSEGFENKEDYGQEDWIELDKQIGNLFSWARKTGNDLSLTNIWFFSIGIDPDVVEWSLTEKLYILKLLASNHLLDEGIMFYGGDPLAKLLSIIMKEPFSSIKESFKIVDRIFGFNQMDRNDDAQKAANELIKLQKIKKLISSTGLPEKGRPTKYVDIYEGIFKSLQSLEKEYNQRFYN